MTEFEKLLHTASRVLAGGSLYERLRRYEGINFDPHIAHAALIYDAYSAQVLTQVHHDYLKIGRQFRLPMIAAAATWRATPERIARSSYAGRDVIADNVRFMRRMLTAFSADVPIFLGGSIGCRGDAYKPQEALSTEQAVSYHMEQVAQLAATSIDYIFAATLPALSEAAGLA